MLSCSFLYGGPGDGVLGVAFRRDLFVASRQVFPPLQDREQLTHTALQRQLLHKLGDNAFPFFFEPGASDVGKVSHQVTTRTTNTRTTYTRTTHTRTTNTRTTHTRTTNTRTTNTRTTRTTNTRTTNTRTTRTTNTRTTNTRTTNTRTPEQGHWEGDQKCAVEFEVTAFCGENPDEKMLKQERRGLALDGRLKHQDTNLASSSIVKQEVLKEVQGMLVSYKVVVRMMASG
ncbi:Beta-arrestin-1 [Liparis tanakae]|uniref:Beta-arrestin-1 n=1 Tax=Liparis tanakae TaxID=230148 RepID=A0A4Z2E808_9TELE|nr:Beta-arrestin-1 [Liparis tanakae]